MLLIPLKIRILSIIIPFNQVADFIALAKALTRIPNPIIQFVSSRILNRNTGLVPYLYACQRVFASKPFNWLKEHQQNANRTKFCISASVNPRFLVLFRFSITLYFKSGLFSACIEKKILPSCAISTRIASFSGNLIEETEFGVVISTGSGGLNFVAMHKERQDQKRHVHKGSHIVSVLFLGIFTLGIFYKNFVLRCNSFINP